MAERQDTEADGPPAKAVSSGAAAGFAACWGVMLAAVAVLAAANAAAPGILAFAPLGILWIPAAAAGGLILWAARTGRSAFAKGAAIGLGVAFLLFITICGLILVTIFSNW